MKNKNITLLEQSQNQKHMIDANHCFVNTTAYQVKVSIFMVDLKSRCRDRMVVGFTTTYAISAYHHWWCEFESRSGQGVLDTTWCDKVCQWLAAGRWFSPGTPVSSINKTDCQYIAEILLKVALNTISLTLNIHSWFQKTVHVNNQYCTFIKYMNGHCNVLFKVLLLSFFIFEKFTLIQWGGTYLLFRFI